ncbi:partition ParB-like nuclease protein [Xanthomonas phage JGB6]|nr:partition ParB-like nuclease protein [Xanthomonas phage JGB6]
MIAGEHTTRVARELGYEAIDAYNLGVITDAKAEEISIIDNQHYGVEDHYGLGKLLQEISEDTSNPADFLPFSDRELNNIFRATQIDLASLDLMDEGDTESMIPDYDPEASIARAPVDSQVMRFKVPIKDADFVTRVIEGIIKRQGLKQTDSLAAAGDALVYLCNNRGDENV